MKNFSKTEKLKISNFKLHYLDGATLVGTKEMPLLRKTDSIPYNVISFSEMDRVKSKKEHWIDFFVDDYRFEYIWELIYLPIFKDKNIKQNLPSLSTLLAYNNLYQFDKLYNKVRSLFNKLKRFAGIISPDFSMYPEFHITMREYNCFRNRAMAYYLQKNDFNVVPSVSWAIEKDFEYCFDGIPKYSSVAISSNGCKNNEYSKRIFLCGVEELQRKIEPSTLIVCGFMKELEKYTNIKFYPSFSERRLQRIIGAQMKRDKQLLLPLSFNLIENDGSNTIL